MGIETVRGRQIASPQHHWRLDGPADDPTRPLVVAMHGYGMDEDLFSLLLQKLHVAAVRVLIPRGPFSGNLGLEVENPSSWYEYDGDQERFRRELERLEREIPALVADVEREQGLTPAARYVLGFSQGGYAGSWVALRRPDVFRGMLVTGARVKTEWLADEIAAAAGKGFAALICHGERDHSVKPEAARRSVDDLRRGGVDAELKLFDAGHSVGRAQVRAMAEWLGHSIARSTSS